MEKYLQDIIIEKPVKSKIETLSCRLVKTTTNKEKSAFSASPRFRLADVNFHRRDAKNAEVTKKIIHCGALYFSFLIINY